MGLRDQAILDARKITSNNASGFGIPLTFVSRKAGSFTATIIGVHTRHHYTVTSDGAETNDLNAHASFSEQLLIASGYPYRNIREQIDLKDDFLYAVDSAGINRKYKINQVHADESMGIVRCILEDCA